jgi:hypothetical protein
LRGVLLPGRRSPLVTNVVVQRVGISPQCYHSLSQSLLTSDELDSAPKLELVRAKHCYGRERICHMKRLYKSVLAYKECSSCFF